MEYNQTALNEIANLKDFELATLAACGLDNEAASQFLIRIRNDVLDAITEIPPDDWEVQIEESYIPDGAISIYTHTMWDQFVGTRAWTEDISDYGDIEDMAAGASRCLYEIAQRLVWALSEKILESMTSDPLVELGL